MIACYFQFNDGDYRQGKVQNRYAFDVRSTILHSALDSNCLGDDRPIGIQESRTLNVSVVVKEAWIT